MPTTDHKVETTLLIQPSISQKKPVQKIETIREWYLTSLFICFAGIIGFYSSYAYLEESLIADKEKKLNTNFIMGTQSLIAVLISSAIIKFGGMGSLFGDFSRDDVILGILNFLPMYCSQFALKFVNYPFMVLAKSAKILSIILAGFLTGKQLTWAQVGIAITITTGLIIFNSNKVADGFADGNIFGIVLLLLSLLFDGVVCMQGDKNHQQKKRQFAYHQMLYNNIVGLVGNAAFYAMTRMFKGDSTLERVMADSTISRDVLLLALCGAAGQIFIFLTLSLYDCYKLSVITTSRKCISVIVSTIAFNHSFTLTQWSGASLVLGSTCLEVYLGNKRKREQASIDSKKIQ